jgi:hypothetical protein
MTGKKSTHRMMKNANLPASSSSCGGYPSLNCRIEKKRQTIFYGCGAVGLHKNDWFFSTKLLAFE